MYAVSRPKHSMVDDTCGSHGIICVNYNLLDCDGMLFCMWFTKVLEDYW
jgi:hypothetical protein